MAVKFGLFFPQVGLPFAAIRERAQLADRLGFDSVLFVDHMWARGLPDVDHFECWTLMTAIAMSTQRLRVGALVLCNSYRNPALLAKMASSLDVISGGRLVLGVGAGWMDEEYRAYGYPFPNVRTRIEQLDEALDVMKRLFTQPRASYQGKYYAVEDAPHLPRPLQQPHPPILIGGAGEQRLLRVVARHADIWNCPNNHAENLPRKLDVLRGHCEAIGRDPFEITVSEQCIITVARTEAEFRSKFDSGRATLGRVFEMEKAGFHGTPGQVVEQIRARIAQGVTYFTFLTPDFQDPESLTLLAEEVLPAFR
jgi:F420-dependent oxidoreductase-like protein